MPSIKTITLQNPQNNKTFNFEMIRVEGGSFKMGARKPDWAQPIHKVNIPTFHIGKHPVIQALYEFVMGENPSHFKGAKRPVEQVSWHDAKAFVEKLNTDFGNLGFRLLSEAEWEYAARGGNKGKHDGFKYAGSRDIGEVAWYGENSHRESQPVGRKKPNQLGIYDMTGNVWELCEDDWHEDYEDAPKDGSAWIDAPRHSWRVHRGGSWSNHGLRPCQVTNRASTSPDNKSSDLGFRLGLS